MPRLRLRPRPSAALRCPVCRCDFGPEDAPLRCELCQTTVHEACRAELDACPTLGCQAPPIEAPRPSLLASFKELLILVAGCGIAITCGVGFGLIPIGLFFEWLYPNEGRWLQSVLGLALIALSFLPLGAISFFERVRGWLRASSRKR